MLSVTSTVWGRFCGRRNHKTLESLPEDILVNEIFVFLDLKDILVLRCVSKTLCFLTMQPTIWKRFTQRLSNLPHPLPALPPTDAYSVRRVSPLALERIVTRSISLDENWRSRNPRPYSTYLIDAIHDVTELTLLPGGHYMVAAMKERCGLHVIVVWAMEYQHQQAGQRMAPLALATHFIEGKPYGLKTKYMKVKGKKGIVITYVTAHHKRRGDPRDIPELFDIGSIPPASGSPTDPTLVLKYEAKAVFVSLDTLEEMTSRRLSSSSQNTPEPTEEGIEVVSCVRTGHQILGIAVGEVCLGFQGTANEDRMPVLCVAKRPNTVLFEELCTGRRTALEVPPSSDLNGIPQCIMNVQLLPSQRQFLSVREAIDPRPGRKRYYAIELFAIPPFEPLPPSGMADPRVYRKHSYDPLQSLDYDHMHEKILNVQISEPDVGCIAPWDPTIRSRYAYNRQANGGRPPMPLSLYFNAEDGMTHLSLWPMEVEPVKQPMTPPRSPSPPGDSTGTSTYNKKRRPFYFYTLDRSVMKRTGVSRAAGDLRALPGSHRAMVLGTAIRCISADKPVLGLYAYLYDGARRIIPGDKVGAGDAGVFGTMAGKGDEWSDGMGPVMQMQMSIADGMKQKPPVPMHERLAALFDPINEGDPIPEHDWEGTRYALETTMNLDTVPPMPNTPPTPTSALSSSQESLSSFSDVWSHPRIEPSRWRGRLAKVTLHKALAEEMKKGVVTTCWDEDSGRMVIVTSGRGRDSNQWRRKMWVLEFGFGRKSDAMDEKILEKMLRRIDEDEASTALMMVD